MKIDNKYSTAMLKVLYALNIVFILTLTAYYFFEWNRPLIRDFNLLVIILLIITYISGIYIKLYYFFIDATGNNIIVRYYNSHPFLRKYKAFEIPKPYFHDYKIEKSFLSIKKDLILTAKTPKGFYKYPSISVSACNKKKYNELIALLEKIKNHSV